MEDLILCYNGITLLDFFRKKSKKRAKKFGFSEIVPLYLQYLILDNLYDLIII